MRSETIELVKLLVEQYPQQTFTLRCLQTNLGVSEYLVRRATTCLVETGELAKTHDGFVAV